MTCYIRSCSAVAYRPAPIRLQLFCIAMVTRGRNNCTLLFNISSVYSKSPDPLLPRKGLAARDYAYAWIGNAPVYGVVHGVSGYYTCNTKINGGSWLQKIVWSLRQTVTTGASIHDTAK